MPQSQDLSPMALLMQSLPKPAGYNVRPKPAAFRFWEKVFRTDGCWWWVAGTNEHGYGLFNRSSTRKALSTLAHRFSWELHYGPIPGDLCVLHDCDNPLCVRPSHLFLGTRTDNAADKVAKGRQRGSKGVKHYRCLLTEAQVLEIRERAAAGGIAKAALAREYGIATRTLYSIIAGGHWRHLLPGENHEQP